MRGGRSLLVLLVVALGLGAYIYFVESERDPAGTVARERVFDLEAADITDVTIQSADAPPTTVRKAEDRWTLSAPVAAPADSAAIDSITSSLATMEIDRVIEEPPGDLAPFGLDASAIQVSFTTTD
jgi:hypothetical protein